MHLIDPDNRAYLMPADHWGNRATGRILRELYGAEPVYRRVGGTLPITKLFRDPLGVYTVILAFASPDGRSHAPDEFYRFDPDRVEEEATVVVLERFPDPEPLAVLKLGVRVHQVQTETREAARR